MPRPQVDIVLDGAARLPRLIAQLRTAIEHAGELTEDADHAGFEVVEARQEVFHLRKPVHAPKKPVGVEDEEDNEDDENEEELEPELRTQKERVLAALVLDVSEMVVWEVVVAPDGAGRRATSG